MRKQVLKMIVLTTSIGLATVLVLLKIGVLHSFEINGQKIGIDLTNKKKVDSNYIHVVDELRTANLVIKIDTVSHQKYFLKTDTYSRLREWYLKSSKTAPAFETVEVTINDTVYFTNIYRK